MKYMTTSQVADELNVKVRTVERWRETGYFKPDRRTSGNHSRYLRERVCQLKQERQFKQMMS